MSFFPLLRLNVMKLTSERDDALRQLDDSVADRETLVKEATKEARQQERQHYSKKVEHLKHKSMDQANKITSLTKRTVTAEVQQKKAERQVKQSTRRSESAMEYTQSLIDKINELEGNVRHLHNENADLQLQIQEKDEQLRLMDDAFPIKVFSKVRYGRGGQMKWPLYVWELIIKEIVNGTPPSAIGENIIANIRTFSPKTVIKELPSKWTVRRARTVLYVIVQTLAAYRLGKSKKWRQGFTDGTGRRQVEMQNLLIDIEEDLEELK